LITWQPNYRLSFSSKIDDEQETVSNADGQTQDHPVGPVRVLYDA